MKYWKEKSFFRFWGSLVQLESVISRADLLGLLSRRRWPSPSQAAPLRHISHDFGGLCLREKPPYLFSEINIVWIKDWPLRRMPWRLEYMADSMVVRGGRGGDWLSVVIVRLTWTSDAHAESQRGMMSPSMPFLVGPLSIDGLWWFAWFASAVQAEIVISVHQTNQLLRTSSLAVHRAGCLFLLHPLVNQLVALH